MKINSNLSAAHTLPHRIQGPTGEVLIFQRIEPEADGDKLICENFVAPMAGPPMHVHFLQDEALTVVSGKMGYQIMGEAPQYAQPGESVVFKRGVAHRFWNAGTDTLNCTGWVKPANSLVFFLDAIYAAQNKTGTDRPELFDAAYLTHRYRSEYEMMDIPPVVKKVVMPIVYGLGVVLGKYRKFRHAPQPL